MYRGFSFISQSKQCPLRRGGAQQRSFTLRPIASRLLVESPERDEGAKRSLLRIEFQAKFWSDSSRCANTIAGSVLVAPQMQYETIILRSPHRSQQSKGPALRSHVVALTQPRPCKVISARSTITSIHVFCQYSASGLASNADLALSPQVIENTHCDGICRLTRHHRARFCSSTPAIEMQKLWCLGGVGWVGGGDQVKTHFCFPCWILWSGNSLSASVQPSGSCAWYSLSTGG